MEEPRCSPMRIIIVGSGFAGLATALALLRHPRTRQHRITILERRENLKSTGSAIGVWSNCNRLLDYLGVFGRLERRCGARAVIRNFRRWDTGEILMEQIPRDMRTRFGYPAYNIHRGELQQILLQSVLELGLNVKMGCHVEYIDIPNSSIILESGEVLRADLIIGADGIKSAVRRSMHPHDTPLTSKMDIFYCGVSAEALAADPTLAPLLESRDFWWGPQGGVVNVAVRSGNETQYFMEFPYFGPGAGKSAQDVEVKAEVVKTLFQNWDSRIGKALDLVDEGRCSVWTMAYHDLRPGWVHEPSGGKVVLIGDAAHAMLPHSGQVSPAPIPAVHGSVNNSRGRQWLSRMRYPW